MKYYTEPSIYLFDLLMFDEIKKNDIVVLKTKNRRKNTLIIRAIGIVKDSERSENELGYCKKVRWLDDDPEGIKTIQLYGDGGVQRNTRIYREYNPDIIKQIDELVKKYKKD